MGSHASASPTYRAGAAQAAGYSTGSARGGGKHWTQLSSALVSAITSSQAKYPKQWEKATGTTDIAKQLKMVSGVSDNPNNRSFFISNADKVSKQIKALRDQEKKYRGNHPDRAKLLGKAMFLREQILIMLEEILKVVILEKQQRSLHYQLQR